MHGNSFTSTLSVDCPLKFVDGREVTYEERERIELMFVTDTRAMPHSLFYVDNQQHAKHQGNMQMGYAQLGQQLGHQGNSTSVTTNGMGGPRVPVKLTRSILKA